MDVPMKIQGCRLTPLRIMPGEKGGVLHAMRSTDEGFVAFGEAYFSAVKSGETKSWRRHHRMTLNLVVPVGKIRFLLHDERPGSPSFGIVEEVVLHLGNYQRLTVPPGVWLAFEGLDEGLNLLLNVADLPHDPAESETKPFDGKIQGYLS
jgi:dTDP-4-dehydrorhamnose 3,5-epimerase